MGSVLIKARFDRPQAIGPRQMGVRHGRQLVSARKALHVAIAIVLLDDAIEQTPRHTLHHGAKLTYSEHVARPEFTSWRSGFYPYKPGLATLPAIAGLFSPDSSGYALDDVAAPVATLSRVFRDV